MNEETKSNEAQAVGNDVVGELPTVSAPLAPTSGSPRLRVVTLELKFTSCAYTMDQAMDEIRSEILRLGDVLAEGDTFAESGNLYYCDYGGWKINDPWEENNKAE